MSLVERSALIIRTIEYMTIATVCPDGKPWNTPVYTAFDPELNFYWASWTENRHSLNIAERPDVFIVLYDSRAKAGEGEGVYFQAVATTLLEKDKEEIAHGYDLLRLRAGTYEGAPEQFARGVPRRMYKASPVKIWINDFRQKDGDWVDFRQEIGLEDLRQAVART